MINTYRFAGQAVEVDTVYPDIHERCRDYAWAGAPDFRVRTDRQDIAFEREKSAREEKAEGLPHRGFSEPYLESLAVYRKIAERMPAYGVFLYHGSAIAVDGEAYLFSAKSGVGKSTHARLWRELLGEKAVMVNDDKPLIRVSPDGSAVVCGTPWDGKHRLSCNTAVPLKAICLLNRAQENSIRTITKDEALPHLLQQAYRPSDREALERTLELIDRMQVSFYRLDCNMDISAAELSCRAMRK